VPGGFRAVGNQLVRAMPRAARLPRTTVDRTLKTKPVAAKGILPGCKPYKSHAGFADPTETGGFPTGQPICSGRS